MTLDALIMFAGVLVAAWPFLGFPPSWDTPVAVFLGICIVAFGIIVRRRSIGGRTHTTPHQPAPQSLDDGEVA